ncbi:hypothetical protein [Catellatospora paridis]|uniref:hypothetical protein n=1 Tax=Catellatospora paridis TaxID=1617086 RepID=UPI0012D45BE1|nr:hypothetical protein [Catellatospora paridis]
MADSPGIAHAAIRTGEPVTNSLRPRLHRVIGQVGGDQLVGRDAERDLVPMVQAEGLALTV